jgi:spore germination protein
VLSGDTALYVDGYPMALLIATRGYPNRGVQSAETEVAVQGSKEAFNEVIRFNTTLIRRRIRDTRLKVKPLVAGRRSRTDIALVYMEDIARPEVVEGIERRILDIDIDAILDSGYIEQLVEEKPFSVFPQLQVTERPDKAASAVLEGRVVVVVDNSPFALIVPATLNTFFQASEDYYQRWEIMSFVRLIRYAAGLAAIALPGLFLAITTFHPSMLPMLLIFKMAGAQQSIPFPAAIEVLLMELTFELLREAGIRLPGPVGGTIGIVGGLIMGQAAVEAGLVSPIVVIVAAATGIASFAVPHVSFVTGLRLAKYFVIALSGVLGLYGFCLAMLTVLIHLASLRSFGVPYLSPFAAGSGDDMKDSLIRAPLKFLKTRPIFARRSQTRRLREKESSYE